MVKCKNCGKGRPRLFNKDGGFCNQACYDEWRAKEVERPGQEPLIEVHRTDTYRLLIPKSCKKTFDEIFG